MTWFKVDDGFWAHPKVGAASNEAIALWVKAGCYTVKYKLHGHIPEFVLRLLGTRDAADELVERGLWVVTDDGWKFHQWRRWQDGDYRPNIRRSVRAAVMERDGHRCVQCGSLDNLSLDHIIRYRDDGPDTVENLRLLCMPCNLERG